MPEKKITEDMLASLRLRVNKEVSYSRYLHILGVERCAMQIAEYFPEALGRDEKNIIRASALLHDVTKDKGIVWFKDFIKSKKIQVPDGESVQLYHTLTAPEYIRMQYPNFSSEAVLSAVVKHTTGDREMSLTDKIICLSDYIEDGRKNASCEAVRAYFKNFAFKEKSQAEREIHLDRALLMSFEFTRNYVLGKKESISERTLVAIETLKREISNYETN